MELWLAIYNWCNRWVPPTAQVLADILTLLVASGTIYGLIKYRKKIPSLIRALLAQHLSERFSKVRDTLSLIDSERLTKNSTKVRTLFARLNGQLISLAVIAPELGQIQKEVEEIADRNGVLNESVKARLVHQIEGALENSKINGLIDIAGEVRNGR